MGSLWWYKKLLSRYFRSSNYRSIRNDNPNSNPADNRTTTRGFSQSCFFASQKFQISFSLHHSQHSCCDFASMRKMISNGSTLGRSLALLTRANRTLRYSVGNSILRNSISTAVESRTSNVRANLSYAVLPRYNEVNARFASTVTTKVYELIRDNKVRYVAVFGRR